MELRTLKYFIVVAEELNITKASKILSIQQPPLSNQIKNLEDELKTKLFIRGKRQLKLTEEGKYLYQKAKDIIRLVDESKSEIHNMSLGLKGVISIGLVEGMAPDIAANWISSFMTKYPLVKFRVIDGNSDDLIEKMRSGLISLAVITSPYDQILLNSIKVGEEKMVAFLNKNHHLIQNKSEVITLEELINEPLIVPSRKTHIDNIKRWFKKIKKEPNIVCEMDNYLDAIALANRNVGISIFPKTEYILNSSIVSKDIGVINANIEYLFVWRKGHQLSIVEENFIDYIKSIFKVN